MGCLCDKCADQSPVLDDDEPSATAPIIKESPPLAPADATRKTTDICALQNTKFIIQGGTHYIEVLSLRSEVSLGNMKPLRESCKNGDHYLATEHYSLTITPLKKTCFFVIKGKSCIRVEIKSVSGGVCGLQSGWRQDGEFSRGYINETIFDLHHECQGGSFYCANKAGFYIIQNRSNTYLHVRNMSKEGYQPSTASHHKLHETFTDALNYFATDDYFYVLKEHVEFGLVYHRTTDLRSNTGAEMFPVSDSVASIICSTSLNQRIRKGFGSTMKNHKEISTEVTYGMSGSIDAKPNSGNLTVIKWKNEKGEVKTFQLKNLIKHKWREIGDHVVPWEILEVWAQEKNAEACCKELLMYWLNNPPPNYPATWEGLYELLVDSELSQVAANLKQAVENAI